MDEKINYRGQVAIWVIIGVILMASILLFFMITRGIKIGGQPDSSSTFEMQSFLEQCAGQHVSDALENMLPRGGFIDSTNSQRNTILFNGIEVEYLCKNLGNYKPCVNQHPVLIQEMEKEIETYLNSRIDGCLQEMQSDFERLGGSMTFTSPTKIEVKIAPEKIILKINKKTSVEKNGERKRFESFSIETKSPVWKMATIANEIANQEAQYCYFEFVGYSALYPDYEVRQYITSDSTAVYTIIHTKSEKEMNIATRSCALPYGL